MGNQRLAHSEKDRSSSILVPRDFWLTVASAVNDDSLSPTLYRKSVVASRDLRRLVAGEVAVTFVVANLPAVVPTRSDAMTGVVSDRAVIAEAGVLAEAGIGADALFVAIA